LLVVIAAPGGYGKDTVAQRLCEVDPRFVVSRSWTTRAPRPGEPADAYTFVDRDTFEARIAADGFLEWAEYHGNLYGTPKPDPDDPRHLVLTIEIQGALNVLGMDPDAVMILLELPAPEMQAERMRERGDDEASIRRRVEGAFEELAEGRKIAHATVVNDDLTRAVDEVRRILVDRLSGRL
jgi:guanylate kinase